MLMNSAYTALKIVSVENFSSYLTVTLNQCKLITSNASLRSGNWKLGFMSAQTEKLLKKALSPKIVTS